MENVVKRTRETKAYLAAGLSANPTPAEFEMARQLKRTIKIESGPISKEEIQAAYSRMAHRFANPSTIRNGQPRLIDVNGPELGGSDGDVKYEVADPMGGFADPFSQSFRRR